MSYAPDEITPPIPIGTGDSAWLARREDFYERVLGPMREPAVYHWNEETDPHVDVYHIRPTERWPAATLITGGMADRPQPGLRAGEGPARRLELLMRLIEVDVWAAEVLRGIALLPFLHEFLLVPGSLIRGSGPVRPGSRLQHALLLEESAETGLGGFVVEGEEVSFLRVCLITEEERRFGAAAGVRALRRVLDREGCAQTVDPERESIV